MYTLCAYCERTAGEVCGEDGVTNAEEALRFTVVNTKRVLLCARCRARWAAAAPAGGCPSLLAPVDFPPGTTSIDHYCERLRPPGRAEPGGDFELRMHREGEHFVAQCPYCGVRVRSLAAENVLGGRRR